MSTERQTSYAKLADVIANLPLLLREARRARGLSLRKAAVELDMSQSTVMRMEDGNDCALSNAVAVLRWLDQTSELNDLSETYPGSGIYE